MQFTHVKTGYPERYFVEAVSGDMISRSRIAFCAVERENASFSPLVSTNGDKPWLVAAFGVGLSVISLVAFLSSCETKGLDMEEIDPTQNELVTDASPTEARELAMNR